MLLYSQYSSWRQAGEYIAFSLVQSGGNLQKFCICSFITAIQTDVIINFMICKLDLVQFEEIPMVSKVFSNRFANAALTKGKLTNGTLQRLRLRSSETNFDN